ncbi:MAG: NAD(+)/NADH kinase [Candidatus Cloacimonadaceae bacterium]|jgi:NAD+ kinase|nr:NAD(+)/NADH kinase [Candidatus Cloacimonadota bacterium]MDX9949136.1 NAD(+)/NADH kinase [Candidatus Syntrophosphaera sp.]NLN84854.1 NAD(+)/NADH kinase [Candidatus Cloacimonadota bacterium]
MTDFAIYVNPAYAEKARVFDLLKRLAAEYEIQFWGSPEQRELLPAWVETLESGSQNIDCVLVFGGDGTILRAKYLAIDANAPILGVNLGYLGFLSEATLADLEKSIRDLIHKKYRLLSRMLIKCELRRNGKIEFSGLALNDAVIHKADTPRLIRVRIFSGGRFVFDTRCDGVVASTPTGSTAYSLAAGGPILAPDLRAIVLNPLNPHLLTIRSMVFSRRDSILMRVHGLEAPAALQLDGVTCSRLQENDEVLIRAAKEQVQFIKLSNRTFYQILRRKMNLGK